MRFADLPQIEGATGRFLLQQMVAVAELEGRYDFSTHKGGPKCSQGPWDEAGRDAY